MIFATSVTELQKEIVATFNILEISSQVCNNFSFLKYVITFPKSIGYHRILSLISIKEMLASISDRRLPHSI